MLLLSVLSLKLLWNGPTFGYSRFALYNLIPNFIDREIPEVIDTFLLKTTQIGLNLRLFKVLCEKIYLVRFTGIVKFQITQPPKHEFFELFLYKSKLESFKEIKQRN